MKIFRPASIPPEFSSFGRASTATYVDDAGALQTAAVNALRYQGGLPLVEPEATNTTLQSQNLSVSPWVNCSRTLAAEFWAGNVPFYEIAKQTTTGSEGVEGGLFSVAAGSTWTMTVALLAGNKNTCTVGLYGSTSSWGLTANCSREILSGPGMLSVHSSGAIWHVNDLSSTVPTLVRITRTYQVADSARVYIYPGRTSSTTIGDSVKATRVQTELGAVATSYIPTTTAAVTRAADVFTPSSSDLTGATGSGFLWTNLVPLAPLYEPTLSYAAGVQRLFRGGLYALAAGQTAAAGESPATHPAKWQFIGVDRRLAPFDGEYETRSGQFSVTPAYSYIIGAAGPSDSLLLAGLSEVASISVRITSSLYGPVIFESTVLPPAGQPVVLSQQLFSGFSAPSGAVIRITLNGRAGFSHGVRHIAWGQSENLGGTRYGARAGMRDFSRKEADDFGRVQFVRRAFSKTVSASVEVEKTDINRVSDRLYELRATPLGWIFTDDPDLATPLVVFGFYKDFYSVIDKPMVALYTLEIEGLT